MVNSNWGMNSTFKKVTYKLYLSLQAVVFAVGACILIWNLVAGIHDVWLSSKSRECIRRNIGSELLERSNIDSESEKWTENIERYAKALNHPTQKYALKALLERQCSEYLSVSIYEPDGGGVIYLKNYIDAKPASIAQRAGYMLLTLALPLD